VSWNQHHSRSESLASDAEAASRGGDTDRADELYREAAQAESQAFDQLTTDKPRTRGITAVSAVSLWCKAREYATAEKLAHRYLADSTFQPFAEVQLRELLESIWTSIATEQCGIRFVRGDALVSVKGGQIIHGGAPLDLIIRKVEGIQAVLFRTVEMLLGRPFRKRGGPEQDVQAMFKPWLFQAPAGSYQFAVRVQEPVQGHLWQHERPSFERVTSTFFDVLRASSSDPEAGLSLIVPDPQYREAFLSLSRNLAPTGKTFDRLEIRDVSLPGAPVASFVVETRRQINAALRSSRPPRPTMSADEEVTLQGVLRAVHLDEDWLEVTTETPPVVHIRVEEAGDALDDVVGPMVNRRVVVKAIRRGSRHLYRDIELDD
jgi:hypothetical protein